MSFTQNPQNSYNPNQSQFNPYLGPVNSVYKTNGNKTLKTVVSELENTYNFWAKRNIIPFSFFIVWNVIWLTILIVIMCDAHWACATKANPIYINFNQLTWIGLWYRCNNYYGQQDSTGGSVTYYCNPMDPTIQILPPLYIYCRMVMVFVIMFATGQLLMSILTFPYVKYSYQNKRKLTLYQAILSLTSCIFTLSVTIWFVAASYSNGLGWVSAATAPVNFVQPYVSAWKPAWCSWLGLFTAIFGLGITVFMFFTYKNMPEFDAEGKIVEILKENEEDQELMDGKINQPINPLSMQERLGYLGVGPYRPVRDPVVEESLKEAVVADRVENQAKVRPLEARMALDRKVNRKIRQLEDEYPKLEEDDYNDPPHDYV